MVRWYDGEEGRQAALSHPCLCLAALYVCSSQAPLTHAPATPPEINGAGRHRSSAPPLFRLPFRGGLLPRGQISSPSRTAGQKICSCPLRTHCLPLAPRFTAAALPIPYSLQALAHTHTHSACP